MKRRDTLSWLALGPALAAPSWSAPAAPGATVQWPGVLLLDGTRWTAARAESKAVVVVFWSTTCAFCRRHNAHVEKLRQVSIGKPLEVLTVARDGSAQAVRQYLALHQWQFQVTLDSAPMAAALSTRNMIPLTITVDRRGRLKQVIPGEMFEDDVLELQQLAA